MKKIFLLAILIAILFSCNNDNSNTTDLAGSNHLVLKFEHGFNGVGNLILNSTTQTSTNKQKHQFSTLKYIVSNIVLIDEAGKEYAYHFNNPDKGAFIIDVAKATANIVSVELDEIPSNNYKKVRIGMGISQKAYLLGESGQATFLTKAQEAGMFWSWSKGYIFTKLEGKYGETLENTFANHIGSLGNVSKNGTADMYREVTLDLPTSAKVRKDIAPSIHFKVNLNEYLSGVNKLTLDKTTKTDNSHGSTEHLIQVADNLTKIFLVDHVHNDVHSH